MVRKVFFSFHYENDIWRVNQVRNHWVTKSAIEESGYIDAVDFEKIKKQGQASIERWIDNQLNGTSVTVVLIGTETASRPYVQYEIKRSLERGNGLLGVYIHGLKDRNGYYALKGQNPFSMNASSIKTYDWVQDNGYDYFSDWVEQAYQDAQTRNYNNKIFESGRQYYFNR
ncbi:TIR-like domain-containing protein [Candidatus Termititenax persephonae]|uniref:TIR-like domain-containing protein n=1 Tax=Candidatus Termititenax persephonae TaxID=2218525 RepID=A0A388TFQ9_9BACT|nr:TIR-like domain-containing protein [Candidatus Termititenax persephonae]